MLFKAVALELYLSPEAGAALIIQVIFEIHSVTLGYRSKPLTDMKHCLMIILRAGTTAILYNRYYKIPIMAFFSRR